MSEFIVGDGKIISRISDDKSTSTIEMIGSIVNFKIEKKRLKNKVNGGEFI